MSPREKIRFGIAFKLSLVFSSVFLVALSIIYLSFVPQLESRLTNQKLEDLQSYSALYSESLLNAVSRDASRTQLDLLTQQYAQNADARIIIMDVSGNLLSDSLKGQAFDPDDYPVAIEAIQTGSPQEDVHEIGERNFGMAAVPLGTGNTVFQVVIVSSAMDDVEQAVSLVTRQLLLSAALVLVLALATIYLVSYFMARRIKGIESGARRIAQGDFETEVPVKARDELGELATAFNEMGSKLGSAFRQVDEEKRRAQLLLDDLHEGVIGIDADDNIIVCNPAADALLGSKIQPPCPVTSCLPEEIESLWSSMSQEHPNRDDTFILPGEKALMVHSAFIEGEQELASLLVLRDVSQEVKLDRSRRDFIANASHELKTPIFSLGGFLEILQDEDVDESTKEEFIDTMRQQVDRLSLLARNLLDLSQMDSGAMDIQPVPVQLKEVVDSVAREFGALPGDSRIVTDGLPEDLVVRGDQSRTAQLVRILLDNALKYSPEDTSVLVQGAGNGNTVSLTVADQGPGIPEAERSRIFERFYRGKSAGRVRGTGLGLSIAQELARLMQGSIEVDSSEQGTAITVTLPANGAQADQLP